MSDLKKAESIGKALTGVDTVNTRYVLFNDERGIYLGNSRWSYINPGDDNAALTFNNKDANKTIAYFKQQSGITPVKIEVVPDMDFNLISPKALIAQGLPAWGEWAEQSSNEEDGD